MEEGEAPNNPFLWSIPGSRDGQLPPEVQSAVQHFMPSRQATPPTPPGHVPGAAHVINMGGGGGGGGAAAAAGAPNLSHEDVGGEQPQQQQQQQQPLPILKQLWHAMQGAVPFALLLLTKILYDHRLGILVFVGLFGTFYHANSSLRRQIALRETRNLMEWYGSIAWVITFLSANIAFIYYIFDDQELYRSLYLGIPRVDHLDVWNLFWIVIVTDFIIKFITVILKALVALLPRQLLQYKKKGKYYLLVEQLSQTWRSVVPVTPWIYFLQDDQHGGPWFSAALVILYTVCKGGHVYTKLRDLHRAFLKFQVDVSYGLPATQAQLDESENCCPICQDKFSEPVMLTCNHVFCEDCVSLWFDRERTCPMCRANIVDNPMWRDGNTNSNLQIY